MTGFKTAVWCSPHAFNASARVGAHHLSLRLAERGLRVLFLSNPISPFHGLKWWDLDMRHRLQQALSGIGVESSGLSTALPLTLLPFVRRFGSGSHWMLENWPRFTYPNLLRNLHTAGFGAPDLMVLDGPVAAPLFRLLRPKRSVLRVLDRFTGFASTTPALLEALQKLALDVDLVTYSARDLAEDASALGARKTIHIGNGADVAPFAVVRPQPLEYEAIPAPRVVYVGTMAEWFDYELVAEAARRRPHQSYVLIGPADVAHRRLPQLPNLHLLGAKVWNDLPGYLQQAQVGIVPFDVNNHRELVRGVNPLKLYEYAAAGLPVVSVHWPELERLAAPITLAKGTDEFVAGIDRAIADPTSPDMLRSFAWQHDWNSILDLMLMHVDPSNDPAVSMRGHQGDTDS